MSHSKAAEKGAGGGSTRQRVFDRSDPHEVMILKSQLATQFTIRNHDRADFSEFVLGGVGSARISGL